MIKVLRMMWRTRITVIPFSILVLVISACSADSTATPSTSETLGGSSSSAPTPKSGEERVLKVATPFLDEPPDPYQAGWLAVPTGLAETLFKQDGNLNTEPWLASKAVQGESTAWVITLRDGVKFHNGVSMDAEKVKGSLDLALLRRPGTRVLLDIDRIEVKDRLTLVIHTNSPNPVLPGLLTNENTSIADPSTVPTSVDDSAEFASMTSDTRLIALQTGDVDIAVELSPQGAVVVGNDSSLDVRTAAPTGMLFMYVNHESPKMQDHLVRKAITLAVDRDLMASGVADGHAFPANSLFPPGFLSCQNTSGYAYDPETARRLLAEAGYADEDGDGIVEKNGKALELVLQTYPERPLLPPMLEAYQSMLKDIGVGAKVQIVEWTLASQGVYDLFGYSNGTTTTGDPGWALNRHILTGGDENRGNFSNAGVDELIGKLSSASDPVQRQLFACDALQAANDEVALVPVMFPTRLYGVSDSVNWTSGPQAARIYFIDHLIGLK